MKNIIIILFFSLLSVCFSTEYSLRVGDKVSKIQTITLNGSEYVSVRDISKYLFPNSKLDLKKREIQNNSYSLIYHPGNLFIVMENWEGKRISQMGLPVAEYKNKDYLPGEHFFATLDSLELFDVSSSLDGRFFTFLAKGEKLLKPLAKYRPGSSGVQKSAIRFNSEGYPVIVNFSRNLDPFSNSFFDNSRKLSKYFEQLEIQTFNDPSESIILDDNSIRSESDLFNINDLRPTPYFIPEKIIRKEIEEVRQGKK